MTALEKLGQFIWHPIVEFLLTPAEYETLNPYAKGFCSCAQAYMEESDLKHLRYNPYKIKSKGYTLFNSGFYAAKSVFYKSEK